MRLFIDCEFNDFRGGLISMALVAESGEEFYEVIPCQNPSKWVAKNVIPILGKKAASLFMLRRNLRVFLSQFTAIHIVADWPEDIAHFCDVLIDGPGSRINTPPLTMEVLRIDGGSEVPHNALSDARGLRKAILESEK